MINVEGEFKGVCFQYTKTVRITDERLKDLLCNALEGGSNYWCRITGYVNPENVKVEFRHLDLPFIEGCALKIKDNEREGGKPYLLDKAKIYRGIRMMASKFPRHFEDFLNENDDADTGDVFLQCCLFRKVIYG